MEIRKQIESAKSLILAGVDILDEVLAELPPEDPYPIPLTQMEWKNGNLWKPESESNGRVVMLLRADWPVPDKVTVLADDDNWEEFQYAGSEDNGHRHHFRGTHTGAGYRGKKQGGGARVYYEGGYALIPFPGPPKHRYS
jgi:hypothetical protein